MAWIESHEEVWDHHKTAKLCQLLNVEDVTAVGHLISLWHFVLRNAWRDANLKQWGDEGIERATRWKGEKGKMIEALRESGFLNGFMVHGWVERAGRLVYDRKRKENERRVAERRRTNSGHSGGQSKATVPNPTVPNPTQPKKRGADSAFGQFWEAYPKKTAKGDAVKAWEKLNPDPALVATILQAVSIQKKTDSWLKEGGQFIPYPASWLNGRRWEDEIRLRNSGPRSLLDRVMAKENRESDAGKMGGLPDL